MVKEVETCKKLVVKLNMVRTAGDQTQKRNTKLRKFCSDAADIADVHGTRNFDPGHIGPFAYKRAPFGLHVSSSYS